MKRHKNIGIGLLSLLMTANLFAQQAGKISHGFNVEEFPTVSFVYHSYNPEQLNTSNFWYLKEGNRDVQFQVVELPATKDTLPQTTVILWEDMAHNGIEQFNFTQKVLSGFFSDANIPATDKFAVSAFNRRKNTPATLINVTDGFTGDKSQILSSIQGYKHSNERYRDFPNRSDMYTAIREALEMLAPLKGTKSIIVFTSGYSMKNSGADSESQVLLKAQQLHIPVYIFQYYNRSGVAPESEGFARSTLGTFTSFRDIPTAKTALINLYPQIKQRYQGHDYKVSFTANAQRGSDAEMITMSVDGVEIQEQLLPPAHNLGSWIGSHIVLVILIALVIIAMIVGTILFVRKTKKAQAASKKGLSELEEQRLKDKEEAERRQRQLEAQSALEREEQKKKAERERLENLMRIKNIYPRLICRVGGQQKVHEITRPFTLIGREHGDLILEDQTVSATHAEIAFNGVNFEITDKGSTNKVIVNGQIVQQTALRSGDLIGLGDVVITFLY